VLAVRPGTASVSSPVGMVLERVGVTAPEARIQLPNLPETG
jgi:hypothetical protein